MRLKAFGYLVTLATALAHADIPGAEPLDLHALFEARCAACHGHSGDFARASLTVVDQTVVGSRGQSLDAFLGRHQGGLTGDQTRRLLEMFRKQLESGAIFQNRCRTCHGTARDFARLDLILRDGRLFGRYSGREVGPFLAGHGRLDSDEAAAMNDGLTAILLGSR